PREKPRVDIVAAAGGRADEDGDLLALVELRGGILRARRPGRQCSDDPNACEATPHRVLRWILSLISARSVCHSGRAAIAVRAGVHNHCPRLWIPGSRATRAPRNDESEFTRVGSKGYSGDCVNRDLGGNAPPPPRSGVGNVAITASPLVFTTAPASEPTISVRTRKCALTRSYATRSPTRS